MDISPNDPRKVKELVLPNLPKDIDDTINSFHKKYGVRKIDWVQYLIHEMHLDRFMNHMRKAKNQKLELNQELKDSNENEEEEQKYNQQDIDVQEIINKLNDDNLEAINDLDEYIAKNENKYSYEDTMQSEESDIFKPITNCEHSEMESESESEHVPSRFEIDDSDMDEYESHVLDHRI